MCSCWDLPCTHLITHPTHARWLKIARKRFHGSGTFRLNAEDPILSDAMSVEQTYRRLGVSERVIREVQDQLQRVSAGHQAAHEALQSIHQEMNLLRGQIETRSRILLVEPKSLMPDRLRDFVAVVHTALKQAMKNAENQ